MAENKSLKTNISELEDIMDNYRNIKAKDEPKYYNRRLQREFSQSEMMAYPIVVLIMFTPIFIFSILSLLFNIYGLIFFILIGIPTFIFFGFLVYLYIQKYIFQKFCINTDLGKCKISMKRYKCKWGLFIYFYKVSHNTHIKKNIFTSLLPSNRPQYSKLIILRDTFIRIDNLLAYMQDLNGQEFSLNNLLDNPTLDIEYIDIEERQKNKININTAKISQLKKLPFISNTEAIKTAKHIQEKGEFNTMWDFMEFLNLEQEKFETLYKYVFVKQTGKKLSVSEQIKQDLPQFDNTLDIL